MSTSPTSERIPWTLDPELREILVCPVCKGDLLDEPQGLHCPACSKLFPVTDNIPDMIVEAARPYPESGGR